MYSIHTHIKDTPGQMGISPAGTATSTTATAASMAPGVVEQSIRVPAKNGATVELTAAQNWTAKHFDSIESCIAAFAQGEFLVVLDSADRENEGDLIIAAQEMSTEKMAWMVRYTSGLVTAPMSTPLLKRLDLPQMVLNNQEAHSTAFTISCDYAHDTTTGISAHDRALTCRKLADPTVTAADFRRPGHMFPLRAVPTGVVTRQGHTEAAVEFCKLAGMREAGVICELVRDEDGLMMRRDECIVFARKWGLKVCSIEDLVEYVKNKNKVNGDT